MTTDSWCFEVLTPQTHHQTRQLILAGLEEHWGELDPSLNPELDDMLAAYSSGYTVTVTGANQPQAGVIGTGTVLPRGNADAEIVRMSVATEMRRSGLGRAIVAHLEAWARATGVQRVVLETTSAWTEVVAFYLSCGYTITHTEQSDFGEDTWFEKRLQVLEQT